VFHILKLSFKDDERMLPAALPLSSSAGEKDAEMDAASESERYNDSPVERALEMLRGSITMSAFRKTTAAFVPQAPV
jgi:hypothetical protein